MADRKLSLQENDEQDDIPGLDELLDDSRLEQAYGTCDSCGNTMERLERIDNQWICEICADRE